MNKKIKVSQVLRWKMEKKELWNWLTFYVCIMYNTNYNKTIQLKQISHCFFVFKYKCSMKVYYILSNKINYKLQYAENQLLHFFITYVCTHNLNVYILNEGLTVK